MRDIYIANYTNGMMLRASLDLLWHQVSWPPKQEEALTMTEWGPFHLSGNNAPFVPIFIRAADRALHHATNAWRNLVGDLAILKRCPIEIDAETWMQTNDRATKYEIEAFLGAIVSITEDNLIGINTKGSLNRLGKSVALGESLIELLRNSAKEFLSLGFESKWRDIRHSAYHLNSGMKDWGFLAQIRKKGDGHCVELQGIHYVEGASPDLVEIFTEVFDAFTAYVTHVRDLLTEFSFQYVCRPKHRHYSGIFDPLGNMNVCLGPNGYEFRYYPETASDFVGPPRPSTLESTQTS